MLKLIPDPTFYADVEIRVPGAEAPESARFKFRTLGRERLASLLILTRIAERNRIRRLVEYLKLCWRLKRLASVVDMLDEIIVEWDGISEPYSCANLRTLLSEYPGSHIGIYYAYLKGLNEARRKN